MELIKLASITAGHSFRGKIPVIKDTSIYIIQMKDINTEHSINWDTVIETKLRGRQTVNWLQYGDILFIARGQRNYATLIDTKIKKRDVVAAPQFFVIRVHADNMFPKYLAWFLNQTIAQRYFLSNAEGSTTPSIRRQVLEATPIIVPSLQQQQLFIELAKIVRREKQLAAKIIANGEQLMQTLLHKISRTQCH